MASGYSDMNLSPLRNNRREKMRIYICPICRNVLKTVYDFGGIRTVVYNKYKWCDKCDREIVPLATPQETKEE